jgi:hypothetical protein
VTLAGAAHKKPLQRTIIGAKDYCHLPSGLTRCDKGDARASPMMNKHSCDTDLFKSNE